mgnify:CR=1 FL=1
MTNGDTPRLELIGTVVSSIAIVLFAVMILIALVAPLSFAGIPQALIVAFAFVVTLSAIQVVGTDVLRAYRNSDE